MYYGLRSPERPWSCHSSAHLGAPRNNEYYGLRAPGRRWPCHSSAHQSSGRPYVGFLIIRAPLHLQDASVLRPAVIRAPLVMSFLSSSVIWAPLCKLSYNKGAPPPPGCPSDFQEQGCITTCGHQERPWPRRKNTGRPYIRHLVPVPDHQEHPRLPRFYLDLTRRPYIHYPVLLNVHQGRPDQVSSSTLDCPAGEPTPSYLRERHSVI